jgi:hypothetical protein
MAKKKKKILPIERIPDFYDDNSMETDMFFIEQYYSNDINMEVTLYRVNIITTEVDDLYGEALPTDKKFLPPVNLTVMLNLGNATTNNKSEINLESFENMEFDVLVSELSNKNCDITRGDYVSYYDGNAERFFEITQSNEMNTSHEQTLVFRKGYYRHITCSYIKDDVILNFD